MITLLILAFVSFLGWLAGNAAGSYLAAAFVSAFAGLVLLVFIGMGVR